MNEIEFIHERLEAYRARTAVEEDHAVREILQEYVLAALARTDFFLRASFQGGTHLRIFHGLRRFSEDLDFALQKPDAGFALNGYLEKAAGELWAIGIETEISHNSRDDSPVRAGLFKTGTLAKVLQLRYRPPDESRWTPRKLRVKVEVDSAPPAGATHETRFLRFPFRTPVTNFDLPSSFAGKLHALLCRPYPKGRDWYDLDWYLAGGVPVNHQFLSAALDQQGPWAGKGVKTDDAWTGKALLAKNEKIFPGKYFFVVHLLKFIYNDYHCICST